MYYQRIIDKYLEEWAARKTRKPLMLRGARQTGKSTAVEHLGEKFDCFVEINLEKQPAYAELFKGDIDVKRIIPRLAAMAGKPIEPGRTLLFIDEIQMSQEAIMALRFFKEDLPELHVVAAGSLLEFSLEQLPTFGVGRIHSMFMFPMTFDEFLLANGEQLLMEERNRAAADKPLPQPLHDKLTMLFRTYMLVGGMPEAVATWVERKDYLACCEVLDDIVVSFEDDFPKYRKKADPVLLRLVMRSAAVQATKKFVYTAIGEGYKTNEVKKALELLIQAGLLIPVTHTAANGLPLGSEADTAYRKMLLLDTGLLLRILNMTMGDISPLTTQILTSPAAELVNKGPVAEMTAGLEMLHYMSPNIRHDLFYWQRQARNATGEVDYVTSCKQKVLPVEVKAGTQGGMKSLWMFMKEKGLETAVRCSLENFGTIVYTDKTDGNATRRAAICPLYAVSQMNRIVDELL